MKTLQFSTGGNFYSLYLDDSEFAHVLTEGELYDGTAVAAVQIDNLIYTISDRMWRERNAIQQSPMPALRSEAIEGREDPFRLEKALQEGIEKLEAKRAEALREGGSLWGTPDPEGGASK